MKHLPLILVTLAAIIGSTGCATHKAAAAKSTTAVEVLRVEPSAESDGELASVLREAVLHFEFDQAILTRADRQKLERVHEALALRPWAIIRIAGHCDERGTEEYNLALGQRRADVARNYLLALGTSPEAVRTVTFGEEKPLDSREEETAWARNRRDELQVMSLEDALEDGLAEAAR